MQCLNILFWGVQMKPHKWAKEIKAWADGAEIEWKYTHEKSKFAWHNSDVVAKDFDQEDLQFRIKPQPKEQQYLCVVRLTNGNIKLGIYGELMPLCKGESVDKIIGKIKLETEDD
jgi:hypothetical protein